MKQQSLSLTLSAHSDFASYHPGPNRLIVNTLQGLTAGDFIYLWGAPGSGVSHLLQACCEQASTAMYLDLNQHHELTSQVLEGLESYDLTVLDNIEAVAGIEAWEHALFHLYNRCQQQQHSLLVGAHQAPSALPWTLADLASRLKAMLVLHLKPLDDHAKSAALQLRAQQLGLQLPPEVRQFLLHHNNRDLRFLMDLLQQLDHASLRAQRKLTIPFIKHYLGDL